MPEKNNITFEIKEYIGVISKKDNGWRKELNVISWNGQAPKFDMREWDEHHERMSRGLTLQPFEMRKLVDLFIADSNRKILEEGQGLEEERKERRSMSREGRDAREEKEQNPLKEESFAKDAMDNEGEEESAVSL